MTEFFYHNQTGQTHDDDSVLKHHFTFGDYYQPTKFGRSTVRRADYITLNNPYIMQSERDIILLLYPLNPMDLTLNDTDYHLFANHIYGFILPVGTAVTIKPQAQSNLILCECDTLQTTDSISVFNFNHTDIQTEIKCLHISDSNVVNTQNTPFFGLVLDGYVTLNDIKLGFYDGFYTDKSVDIIGNAKILTFSMPVPL